ncbi:hypothetical protein AB0H69_47815 [Streptomyces phaeochromogenes]|uniref:hypothetical protein n=1 Tax=Streptomyces phaeochromogenes TaxID=1923 RepID=UPI003404CEBA
MSKTFGQQAGAMEGATGSHLTASTLGCQADQVLGRPLRDGDQVRVRGHVLQEPGSQTTPRSIDVCAIRGTSA